MTWLLASIVALFGCATSEPYELEDDDYAQPCDPYMEHEPQPVDAEAGRCGDGVAGPHVYACTHSYSVGCGTGGSDEETCCGAITEGCDGSDFRGATCSSLGFAGGELGCDGCVLDVGACRRCDDTNASACATVPQFGARIASWRDRSLLYAGNRLFEVSSTLELTEIAALPEVLDLAPLGGLGVLIAHREDREIKVSRWRGGARLIPDAVELDMRSTAQFQPVVERPDWLVAVGRPRDTPAQDFDSLRPVLLDPRGRPTAPPATGLTGGVPTSWLLVALSRGQQIKDADGATVFEAPEDGEAYVARRDEDAAVFFQQRLVATAPLPFQGVAGEARFSIEPPNSASALPEHVPFRAPGLEGGERTTTPRADGVVYRVMGQTRSPTTREPPREWRFGYGYSTARRQWGGYLEEIVVESERSDGTLWLSRSRWQSQDDRDRVLYGDQQPVPEGGSPFSMRAAELRPSCEERDPVIAAPWIVELAFTAPR